MYFFFISTSIRRVIEKFTSNFDLATMRICFGNKFDESSILMSLATVGTDTDIEKAFDSTLNSK